MQQHPIEPPGESIPPLGRQGHGTLHQLGDLPLQGVIAFGQAGIEMGHGSLGTDFLRDSIRNGLGHLMAGLPQAAAVFSAEQHHGHGQILSQAGGVDADAKTLGLIGHVEQQHRRQAQLPHLEGQPQLAIELAGIEHHHHQIEAGGFQEATHHRLVVGVAAQVVDPRQVDQLGGGALQIHVGLHQIHREPRPIADMGMAAGELVEQGRFARIGHAQNGDRAHTATGHASRSASRPTLAASARRSISSVMPTRTCIGPANQARRSICTRCPRLSPRASRRLRSPAWASMAAMVADCPGAKSAKWAGVRIGRGLLRVSFNIVGRRGLLLEPTDAACKNLDF